MEIFYSKCNCRVKMQRISLLSKIYFPNCLNAIHTETLIRICNGFSGNERIAEPKPQIASSEFFSAETKLQQSTFSIRL